MAYDVIVIGAGIVGAACARELVRAGLSVAICEASDHAGGSATAAGMGHLAVMDDSEAQFALTHYSQKLWREAASELSAEAEYWQCGSLWIAADDEEYREVIRKRDFYTARGVRVETLDSAQLAEAEPQLRPGLAGALLMPDDCVCYPPCAAYDFGRQVAAAGGTIHLNMPVTAISDAGVTCADGTRLTAGAMIAAAGTAVTRLIPGLPVQPRKGHLLITDRYPGFLRRQIIELGYLKSAHAIATDSFAFNAQPRMTGQILLGSSRQYGVEDPGIEDHMLRNMLRRALAYMPGLRDLSTIRTWTGFRAATPDKLPLIGRCPGYGNLYLAAGHEGLGISTSLASARLLADEMLGRDSAIDRNPYRPDRAFTPNA